MGTAMNFKGGIDKKAPAMLAGAFNISNELSPRPGSTKTKLSRLRPASAMNFAADTALQLS
jgi:hypothetical protein